MITSIIDRRDATLLLGGAAVFGLIWLATHQISWMVIHPSFLSGYLLALIAFSLGFLVLRKRLPGLPVGKVSTWLKLHVVSGAVLLPAFWLHLGAVWPNGLFEQGLAALFYALIITGIIGRLLQKVIPILLTSYGHEAALERIPRDMIRLRERVEKLLIDCSAETGKRSLATAYEQSLAWYFRQPRFVLASAFGAPRGRHWFTNQAKALQRSLDRKELDYLERMKALAGHKHLLDLHYAQQNLLRYWLFLHIPLAVAFYVAVLWHIALVHVYAQ